MFGLDRLREISGLPMNWAHAVYDAIIELGQLQAFVNECTNGTDAVARDKSRRLYVGEDLSKPLSNDPEPDSQLGTQWRDIDSAPKDWSAVILFVPDEGREPDCVFEGYYDDDDDAWRAAEGSRVNPTKWQPFPKPPTD